ncbi:hypothetical protein MD484_g1192, partial [Candolleomyces efflorescens]
MTSLSTVVAILATSCLALHWYSFRTTRSKLSAIPTVGSDTYFLSYFSALKYLVSGQKMIEAGYKKYKGGLFKVPTFETASGWLVVAAGQDVSDEIRKASEEYFDADQAVIDLLRMDHTFGEETCKAETYHIGVTRRQLTKNIETLFPEVFDELETAFHDHLPQTEDWASYPAMDTFIHIICRISNRFFFPDLQLCKVITNVLIATGP